MKTAIYSLFTLFVVCFLVACEKKDYDRGLKELEHHYYIGYLPNTNTAVTVARTQTALLKFPVQFYSSFVRDYDAVAYYGVSTTGITNPAVLGQDFAIVDKSGNVIQPVNGRYSITFPQARRAVDTIYVKLLNSTVTGSRKMEVQLMDNLTDRYEVDTFSTAYTRPVQIN